MINKFENEEMYPTIESALNTGDVFIYTRLSNEDGKLQMHGAMNAKPGEGEDKMKLLQTCIGTLCSMLKGEATLHEYLEYVEHVMRNKSVDNEEEKTND